MRRWKDESRQLTGGSRARGRRSNRRAGHGLSWRGSRPLRGHRLTKALDKVFGKRLIVIGGGAQIAQAVLGAVSEADRHNLRGEKISVDTIPLVGEENLAAAVRAVADLDRARALLLAGSIMGGDITTAVKELQAVGIPVISLNMAGTVPRTSPISSSPTPSRPAPWR